MESTRISGTQGKVLYSMPAWRLSIASAVARDEPEHVESQPAAGHAADHELPLSPLPLLPLAVGRSYHLRQDQADQEDVVGDDVCHASSLPASLVSIGMVFAMIARIPMPIHSRPARPAGAYPQAPSRRMVRRFQQPVSACDTPLGPLRQPYASVTLRDWRRA